MAALGCQHSLLRPYFDRRSAGPRLQSTEGAHPAGCRGRGQADGVWGAWIPPGKGSPTPGSPPDAAPHQLHLCSCAHWGHASRHSNPQVS